MSKVTEIPIKEATREEWLEIRQNGIGGSDAGAILGLNRWKTPFEVYLSKVEPIQEDKQSESAYWGTILEDIVAKEFERQTGKRVRRNNRTMISKEYPFMLANVDREVVGENALLECKTASIYLQEEWKDDKIPDSYIIQGQHYLAVTGREKIYYAVLIGGQKFKWSVVERDEELIRYIREYESKFWNDHVLKKVPPVLDGSSAAEKFLKERYAVAENLKAIDLDAEANQLIDEYMIAKENYEKAQEAFKAYENRLKLKLEDAEIGYGIKYEVSWKNRTRTDIDKKKFKEDHPDLYQQYCKTSPYRVFGIKQIKGEE